MTLTQAKTEARKRARIMGHCYYVLGPCPTDGYWAAPAHLRFEFWPDRAPLFTAAPDGRTSTP